MRHPPAEVEAASVSGERDFVFGGLQKGGGWGHLSAPSLMFLRGGHQSGPSCSLFTALCFASFGKTWHQSGASIRGEEAQEEEAEEEINCSLQQQEQQQIVGLPQIRSKLLVLGA